MFTMRNHCQTTIMTGKASLTLENIIFFFTVGHHSGKQRLKHKNPHNIPMAPTTALHFYFN